MKERILKGLEPERVFYYFEEISRIPRSSFKEKAIGDYLVKFAGEHNLKCVRDEIGNVIIARRASSGYENEAPIILQGHMDMVCEKTEDCTTDPEKDGVFLQTDGEWVWAKDTTLGADDGIALAYALALLEDDSFPAPHMEFVCTVSEEVGMEGAKALDISLCRGRRIINIDSEVEGVVLAGCAGGGRFNAKLPVEPEDSDGIDIAITIDGLTGGHSGIEIHKGRGNALRLMVRIMRRLSQETDIRIVEFAGGEKDNAIPRCAKTVLRIEPSCRDIVFKTARDEFAHIKEEYGVTDPMLAIAFNEQERTGMALSVEETKKVIRLILSLPDGVIRMSDYIDNLVETSLNMGSLKLFGNTLEFVYSLRSSVAAAYEALRENMRFMAEGYGADVSVKGEYPAWEYNPHSELRELVCRVYNDQNDKKMTVESVHAGLECGILYEKAPGMDIVSIGPDVENIHTPKERMSIASVGRMYNLLREVVSFKGSENVSV